MRRYNYCRIIQIFCLSLSLNLISSEWVFANDQWGYESITGKILHNYLKSFPVLAASSKVLHAKTMHETILQMDHIKLAPSTQRKIILRTIFSKIGRKPMEPGSAILNNNAWTDLMLFCGGVSNPTYHFLSRINRTNTILGECALATLLVRPTSDIATLSNRQVTLQLLLKNPTCLAALKGTLQDYHKVEESLLSLWTYTDPLYTHSYKAYMNKRFFSSNPATNKNAGKLKFRIFYRNLLDIYGQFVMLPVVGLFLCEATHLLTSLSKEGIGIGNRSDVYVAFPLFVPVMSIGYVVNNYIRSTYKPSLTPFLGVALTHTFALWRGYCGVKSYQEYSAVFHSLAGRMRDVQVFIKTIQKLSTIIAENEALELNYAPSLRAIRALLAASKKPTEIGIMVKNFLEMNLDNWSYIRGNGGKLLATYKLFTEYKDCLKSAMYELGQLDSFIGIAELVQQANQTFPEHCYTFTKFLDRSKQKTPHIDLDGMWNPMLNPQTVIDNNVELDAYNTRNMILSGPNAGGKSSFISGVASNLLLSQTFGIAAARNAIITPFNKINTYIELKDDIASGSSLFIVEVERMQQYINMLENAKPDEFIFTISDEPFARTNPTEASAAAYSIIASIAQYSNALHIVSTHYPILTNLTHKFTDRGIKNFKVFIDEKADQKLHYTYKIVPGEADQATALRILEQEGYDPKLLKQAQEIVEHPEKFSLLKYFQEKHKVKKRQIKPRK